VLTFTASTRQAQAGRGDLLPRLTSIQESCFNRDVQVVRDNSASSHMWVGWASTPSAQDRSLAIEPLVGQPGDSGCAAAVHAKD
jgi:hypothetical protein